MILSSTVNSIDELRMALCDVKPKLKFVAKESLGKESKSDTVVVGVQLFGHKCEEPLFGLREEYSVTISVDLAKKLLEIYDEYMEEED